MPIDSEERKKSEKKIVEKEAMKITEKSEK